MAAEPLGRGDAAVGEVLTAEVILAKSKAPSLERVRNLNLWGSNLVDGFRGCVQLSELYLRKNEVADLATVAYLKDLPRLRILWLCDNPCASHELYRPFVIRLLPQLEKLDMGDVTEEERKSAAAPNAALDMLVDAALKLADEAGNQHPKSEQFTR